MLQETKIQEMFSACAPSFGVGRFYEWKFVEAEGTAGGIRFGIKKKLDLVEVETCLFYVTCMFKKREG